MNPFKDVFISYGRADSLHFSQYLSSRLVDRGYTVWYDFNDIPQGVDYQKQIDDAIVKADNFLFIISPHATNSPHCLKEIERAISLNKRLIPIMHVEKIDQEIWQQRNPDGTGAEWIAYKAAGKHFYLTNLHPEIQKINWNRVSFRENVDDFEHSLQALVEIFERQRDYVHQHTVFLDAALEWEHNQRKTRYLLIGEDRQQAEAWLTVRFKDEQAPCIPLDLHYEFITESIKNANNLMTQVFLSYAEEDTHITERVRRTLMREGITTWAHRVDVEFGSDFQAEIRRGVEEADNFLVLLSPYFLQSPHCQQELELALALNKRIVVMLAERIDSEQVPAALQNLQYIDLTDNLDETDYLQDANDLLRVIQRESSYYNEHKVLLTKALKWQRQQHNPCILLRGYELRRATTWQKVAVKRQQYGPTPLQMAFINESERQPSSISPDVFVSYSRADSDFARRLNDALQRQGKRTWFDQESIASGVDFQKEIYRGIEASNHFLFVLSPNSVNSPYCADEVEYAVSLNKRVVTVRHRPVSTSDLHPELAKVQWIDFQNRGDFAASFRELVRTLDTDPKHLQAHTRLLVRAIEWDNKQRRDDLLMRGSDLTEAEQWLLQATQKEPAPTALQGEYIATSRKTAVNRQRALVGTLASLLVLAVLGSGFAFWQSVQAREARNIAEQNKAAAERSQAAAEMALADATEAEKLAEQQRQAAEIARQAETQQRELAEQRQQEAEVALIQTKQAKQAEAQQRRLAEQKQQEAEASQRQAEASELLAKANEAQAEIKTREAQAARRRADGEALNAGIRARALTVESLMISNLNTRALWAALALGQDIKNISSEKLDLLRPSTRVQAVSALREIYHLDGFLLHNTFSGHERNVLSVDFSPDGQTIASASSDNTVRLWNRQGQVLVILDGHKGNVGSVSFSPDGQTIATASDDKTVKLWNRNGQQLKTLFGHRDIVLSVSFSPDSQTIASADAGGTVKLWDQSGQALTTLDGHSDSVRGVSFSPDGEIIATASDDNTAKLWHRNGQALKTLTGHIGRVLSVSFAPDGETIATASDDRTVKLWNRSGQTIDTVTGHSSDILSVVFSPDGQNIATASADNTVKLWNRNGHEQQTLIGHRDRVTDVKFSPDGQTIATASRDDTVKLWARSGRDLQTLDGHTNWVTGVAYSPDGQTIATASDDTTVKLWNRNGQMLRTLEGHSNRVKGVSFSPDSKTVATASDDGTAKLWDLNGQTLQTLSGHGGKVRSITFSPDGQMIATASDDRTAKLWNRSGEVILTLEGHRDHVRDVAFSPDGETIATASYGGTAKLWNRSGDVLHTLEGHSDRIRDVAFSPDGQMIATASTDGTTKLWDRSGEELRTLYGHTNWVLSVTFSPDGSTIATASADGTIKLWDRDGRELQTLETDEELVLSVSFSPDGSTLISGDGSERQEDGSYKGKAIFWNLELDSLMAQSCDWHRDYLRSSNASDRQKTICQAYVSSPSSTTVEVWPAKFRALLSTLRN